VSGAREFDRRATSNFCTGRTRRDQPNREVFHTNDADVPGDGPYRSSFVRSVSETRPDVIYMARGRRGVVVYSAPATKSIPMSRSHRRTGGSAVRALETRGIRFRFGRLDNGNDETRAAKRSLSVNRTRRFRCHDFPKKTFRYERLSLYHQARTPLRVYIQQPIVGWRVLLKLYTVEMERESRCFKRY